MCAPGAAATARSTACRTGADAPRRAGVGVKRRAAATSGSRRSNDASIGYSASHGCIRMHIPDAEWLFTRVHIGTPVFIVAA